MTDRSGRDGPPVNHPLGRGTVDLPGVIGALGEAGYDGWATVELDSFDGAPAAAAAESLGYFETLLAEGTIR